MVRQGRHIWSQIILLFFLFRQLPHTDPLHRIVAEGAVEVTFSPKPGASLTKTGGIASGYLKKWKLFSLFTASECPVDAILCTAETKLTFEIHSSVYKIPNLFFRTGFVQNLCMSEQENGW